jgi:phosphatidylglycerophosphatase A
MTRLATLISTFFGIGAIPGAPGTVAAAVALPIGYALLLYGGAAALLIAALLASVIGVWASGAHAQAIAKEDPGSSVIDEVAGQLFALLPIAATGTQADLVPVLVAFFLFRLFDIFKPWPISAFENFDSGWGIMADDIASGLISAAILWAMLHWAVI